MNDDQDKQIFDIEVLNSLKEVIGDKVNHIVAVYLDDVPLSLQNMRQSLDRQDNETVGRLAHSLKSSSANVGVMLVSELSANLEHKMKGGLTNRVEISDGITKIEAAFAQARPMLINYIG